MIIVDNLSVLDETEGRADLLINAPSGLCGPDRNGVCAAVAGESVSLS